MILLSQMGRLAAKTSACDSAVSPKKGGKDKDECHAKNPALCPVHGVKSDSDAETARKDEGYWQDRLDRVSARRDPEWIERDRKFLEAVEKHDKDTVREIMRQRAKEAFKDAYFKDGRGNPVEMYHGTRAEFTVFKLPRRRQKQKEFVGGIFFCTKNRRGELANYYAGDKGRILNCFLNITKPKETTPEGRYDVSRERYDGIVTRFDEDSEVSYYDYETDRLRTHHNKKGEIIEIVAFKPSQIKLSDDITYGDDGKPVPPSKRFDFNNPDMRY